jgi:hypothetical protein
MAKRGRKPKYQKDEFFEDLDDNNGRENFVDMEEELLYQLDSSEIQRYIRPHHKQDTDNAEEDSFAYWYGQN